MALSRTFLCFHRDVRWLWSFAGFAALLTNLDVLCVRCEHGLGFVHDFTVALCINMFGLVQDRLTWDLVAACMPAVRAQLDVWTKVQLPRTAEDQTMWILHSLRNSTRGLAGGSISLNVIERVMDLLSDMALGSEAVHCWRLYKILDVRGPDVGLSIGAVVEGGETVGPLPCFSLGLEGRSVL